MQNEQQRLHFPFSLLECNQLPRHHKSNEWNLISWLRSQRIPPVSSPNHHPATCGRGTERRMVSG